MQGVIFGVAHGFYLRARQVLLISASGMLTGIFALRRKTVLPAISPTRGDIFGAVIVRGLPYQ
jgi:hypothetical protein